MTDPVPSNTITTKLYLTAEQEAESKRLVCKFANTDGEDAARLFVYLRDRVKELEAKSLTNVVGNNGFNNGFISGNRMMGWLHPCTSQPPEEGYDANGSPVA